MTEEGDFLRALNNAVQGAFPKLEALEPLVRFEFGWLLSNRVTIPAPYEKIVFDLITLLESDGDLDNLVRAIQKARPRDPDFRRFVQRFRPQFLEGLDDAQATEQVRTGLGAVNQSRMLPEVSAVLSQIRNEVQATAEGILLLEAFKRLHERFHNIDFRLMKMLEKAARDLKAKPTGDNEQYEFNAATEDFSSEVSRARQIIESLPVIERPVLGGWVQKLELAAGKFREALPPGTANPETPIRTFLRPTLGQAPSTIHARLFDEARRLPLGQLIIAVQSILQHLSDATKARLQACVSGLEVLQTRLRDVINEHNFWQKIENDLRLIDDSITTQSDTARWMEDVQLLLPAVFQDIDAICGLRSDANWTRPLQESRGRLCAAQTGAIPSEIRMLFDTYQRRARGRFYDVDSELLQLCSRLVTLSGPLAELGGV